MVNIINNIIWKGNDFYATIHKYYTEGLPVRINAEISENPYNRDEEQIAISYKILKPVNKAIFTQQDELGNKTKYEETDPEKIPDSARSWINLKHDEKGENEFVLFPKSKPYPLINFAFIQAGLVPENNTNGFGFDWDELQDPINDLECNLRVEQRKGTRPYYVPVPSEKQ